MTSKQRGAALMAAFSLFTILTARPVRADPKEEAEAHFEKGKEQNRERKIAEARAEFIEAVKLGLENYKYHQALVLNFIQTREGLLAIRFYQKLEQEEPTSPAVHYWMGRVYMEGGSLPEAAREFSEATRLAPQDEHAFISLGHVDYRLGKEEEAFQAYRRANQLKPGVAPVLTGLGNIYYSRRQYDRARKNYEKALKIDPSLSEARYNLSLIYRKEGKIAQAIAQWKALLEDDPNESRAREQLARAYFIGKQYRDAAEQYQMLSLVREQSPEVFLALGESEILLASESEDREEKLGLMQEARTAFTRTLELDPHNTLAKKYLDRLQSAEPSGSMKK